MRQTNKALAWMAAAMITLAGAAMSRADETAKKLRDDFKPSLVAVKYTLKNELSSQDLSAAGVVVSEDGLVMFPSFIVAPREVPEEQITNVRVIVPSDNDDETELDATYQGRDERNEVAFVKTNAKQTWKAIKFVDVSPDVGETVYSIALMPRSSGYRVNVTQSMISTRLRGPIPQYLVDGALAGSGGVIFNAKGDAIGLQQPRSIYEALLESPNGREDLPLQVLTPSKFFVPSSDFL